MRTACLVPLLLCLTGPTVHAQASGVPAPRAVLTARLDSIAREELVRWRLVGMSVSVVHGRDTLLDRGYGYADLALRVPATASTTYRVIGPALAAAVMRQVEPDPLLHQDAHTIIFRSGRATFTVAGDRATAVEVQSTPRMRGTRVPS